MHLYASVLVSAYGCGCSLLSFWCVVGFVSVRQAWKTLTAISSETSEKVRPILSPPPFVYFLCWQLSCVYIQQLLLLIFTLLFLSSPSLLSFFHSFFHYLLRFGLHASQTHPPLSTKCDLIKNLQAIQVCVCDLFCVRAHSSICLVLK